MLPYHFAHVSGFAPKNATAGYRWHTGGYHHHIKENLVEQIKGLLTGYVETQYFASYCAREQKMKILKH